MDIRESQIAATVRFVQTKLSGAEAGHDWWHIYRVWNMARYIAGEEGAELFVTQIAALLHDISDAKFNGGDEDAGARVATDFLRSIKADEELIQRVSQIVHHISFKGGGNTLVEKSKEFAVVQDADRLDAMGAIGIARAFSYGGYKGREMYNPAVPPVMNMTAEEYRKNQGHTLNHFYEKLLLLKDLMNTQTAKRMAEERHLYMLQFVGRFKAEWDGIA
jgi:uncharacterized protein